jgi:hypothetical protein
MVEVNVSFPVAIFKNKQNETKREQNAAKKIK